MAGLALYLCSCAACSIPLSKPKRHFFHHSDMPTYTLEHGITLVDDALLCQELEIQHKIEISKVLGMVNGKAQVKRVWDHSTENSGTVKGSGDITITPGVGDSGVDTITGGITMIETLKYKQGITAPSDWEYNWFHWPEAEAS